MRKPTSVETLDKLGRVRLSTHFFMRDMLHSEIAQIHGLTNVPDDPDLAIAAGTKLCEELLEPIQERWGRITIRSAYRSSEVNGLGNTLQAEGKAGYNCASNEKNYAAHIWDRRDLDGHMGAMACIAIPAFWDAHQNEGDWQILARWIDENLDFGSLYFYPRLWAVNVGWHEKPKHRIDSYAEPKGRWKGKNRASS